MTASAADHYDVRWRPQGTLGWSNPVKVSPVDEIVIEGLDRSVTYEIEVRAVSACGAVSEWVPSDYIVPGQGTPPAVDALTAASLADGVHLAWAVDTDPPAGVQYSIERSPTGTSGWVERTRVRSLTYTDIETSGTVFYYRVRMVTFAGVYGAYSPIASSAGVSIDALQTEVDNAAADALAANQELANIASDNVLSQSEKPVVIRDTNVITTEQAGIDAQATAFGVTTEKTAYESAVTALTTYLATLTTPVLWSDLSGDTTIVGTTFRSKFADVYTTRQALLNAIYAAAKAGVDGAQDAADVAGSGVPVYNPVFKSSVSGWTFDTAGTGEWYRETGSNSPDASQATYLVHKGVAGQFTTCAHNTGGGIAVKTGQTVTALVALRSAGANAGSRAYVRIGWYNSAGAAITNSTQGVTICTPDSGSNYFSQGVSRVYGTAPTNAVRAIVEIEFDNHTSGYYTATSAWIAHGTQSADEVPESDVRKWAAESGAEKTAGKSIDILVDGTYVRQTNRVAELLDNPDFEASGTLIPPPGWEVPAGGTFSYYTYSPYSGSRSGHLACTAQYQSIQIARRIPVKPGEIYTATAQLFQQGGTQAYMVMIWLDGSGSSVGTPVFSYTSATFWGSPATCTGTAPSGAVSMLIRFANNTAGAADLYFDALQVFRLRDLASEVTGTLASQRRLPLVTWGNYGGSWSGLSLTYSTTTTSCTFSASAASFVGGGDSIAYNASSVTVSGSAGSTVMYYLYYDDPGMTGGSKTLQATTSQITSLNAAGRTLVNQVTVTYPTSGTGGGSGGTPCPDEDAWVLRADPDGIRRDWCVRAKEVEVGHYLRLTDGRIGLVTYSKRKASDRVRVSVDGCALTCSTSAPLELYLGAGECVLAPESTGRWVVARFHGGDGAVRIERVEDAGPGYVQHITCQNACFWTGDAPEYLFGHHNLKPPPAL